MNFQNINFDAVEEPRPWPYPHNSVRSIQQAPTTTHSRSNSQSVQRTQHPAPASSHQRHSAQLSQARSTSPQPPSTLQPPASTPFTYTGTTPSEPYGPDRHRAFRNSGTATSIGNPPAAPTPPVNAGVRFNESQLAMFAADNAAANRMANIKDELAIAAGKVTPGVDDTPYIQYAIAALTGDQGGNQGAGYPSDSSAGAPVRPSMDYQRSRQYHDENVGFLSGPATPPAAYLDDREDDYQDYRNNMPVPARSLASRLPKPERSSTPAAAASPFQNTGNYFDPKQNEDDTWVPVESGIRDQIDPEGRTYAPLTYKPFVLRPFSLLILMTLTSLMIAGLVFCAVYSNQHFGLAAFPDTIYGGYYFVFRILPGILAAVILLYAQAVVTASLRILPFASLASEDPRRRYMALFQKLYATSFLVPNLQGPWQVKVFSVATWLMAFTLPLHSSAFTVLYTEGLWAWAGVQGILWTLAALYIILLVSTILLMTFWYAQWTGLIWDVRSIGTLLPLLHRANGLSSYDNLDTTTSTHAFKSQLRDRCLDRLGYWRKKDMHSTSIWYTIGSSNPHSVPDPQTVSEIMGKRSSYESLESQEPKKVARGNVEEVRTQFLPWCLKDAVLLAFLVAAAILFLALLIISFLPATRLTQGWRPLLSARPDAGAFSAANFLYSFLPSLIGMVLFLLFQSLDMNLRILQPWAELGQLNGSTARKSLLADYTACLPFQVTFRAIQNGHWRVAALSFMSMLFVFIPILGGAIFMALTESVGNVRMYPSMPVFGTLLFLLGCYLLALIIVFPRRAQFQLPHAVTSLAEIISFCTAKEDLLQDSAFRSVRSSRDLADRLGAGKESDKRGESVWFFGVVPGRDEKRLSVRRLKRFTEMRMSRSRGSGDMV